MLNDLSPTVSDNTLMVMSLYNLAVGLAGAYHGYKRNNDSILWGLGWLSLPTLIDIPVNYFANMSIPLNMAISTIPMSLAITQGFAKPLKK